MNYFIILPNQLFDLSFYNKNNNYIIYEHPQYFTKYNFNKKKLILHKASMELFYDNMKKNKYNVKYVSFNNKINYNDNNTYTIYDPVDNIKLPNNITILESPNFLCSKELLQKYRDKTDKFYFTNFYMYMKNELNILKNVKSKDKDNRKKLPKDIIVPKIDIIPNNLYINKAKKYIDKHFKNNYGNTDNFNYPICKKHTEKRLNLFIKERFNLFGNYEDFFDNNKDHHHLYHSVLSSSINIGLINPLDIINIIKKYKSKISINSYEGYIRQLFWREYQRYCHIYIDFTKLDYFNNNKNLTNKWYSGKLECEPVDYCIKKAFDTAYLHHIERLMVIGNYMNLFGIKPKEGFKWFMEFSIDSYEWVMYQNVLDMVFFVSGGKTMRKPYISSSNYILKMSYYSKKDNWTDKWDKLFHSFLKKNASKMKKFTYSYPIVKKYL